MAMLLIVPLLLGLLAGLSAAELTEALKAQERRDYPLALTLFRELAAAGNARAIFELGQAYALGQGVPADSVEAAKWFRLGVAMTDEYAQYALCRAYNLGNGVEENILEAVKLCRAAALKGLDTAQDAMGRFYRDGRGVPRDLARSAGWFRLAAEQNVSSAQFRLGSAYLTGEGVEQDAVQAYLWLTLASASKDKVGEIAKLGAEMVAKALTPVGLAKASGLVRSWAPKKLPIPIELARPEAVR